tara:strand:+ start:882 stop:1394 length:513 start_codon:yes stop_codon:yes gene_type:complete
MVIWIIGLAGVGKTTIATGVWQKLRKLKSNTVLIDGDTVRRIFLADKKSADYSAAGRLIVAKQIQEMCLMLDKQGINVVCGTLSTFEETRIQNRGIFRNYLEIYLTSTQELLYKRRPIYQAAINGEINNVVGVDIKFEEPKNFDLHIDTSKSSADNAVSSVMDLINKNMR